MTPEQQRARDELLNAMGIFRLLDWLAAWLDRHPQIVRTIDTPPLAIIGRYWYVPLIISAILWKLLP